VRDEETVKINIPLFYYLLKALFFITSLKPSFLLPPESKEGDI
jgi:hypothetical protein